MALPRTTNFSTRIQHHRPGRLALKFPTTLADVLLLGDWHVFYTHWRCILLIAFASGQANQHLVIGGWTFEFNG